MLKLSNHDLENVISKLVMIYEELNATAMVEGLHYQSILDSTPILFLVELLTAICPPKVRSIGDFAFSVQRILLLSPNDSLMSASPQMSTDKSPYHQITQKPFLAVHTIP